RSTPAWTGISSPPRTATPWSSPTICPGTCGTWFWVRPSPSMSCSTSVSRSSTTPTTPISVATPNTVTGLVTTGTTLTTATSSPTAGVPRWCPSPGPDRYDAPLATYLCRNVWRPPERPTAVSPPVPGPRSPAHTAHRPHDVPPNRHAAAVLHVRTGLAAPRDPPPGRRARPPVERSRGEPVPNANGRAVAEPLPVRVRVGRSAALRAAPSVLPAARHAVRAGVALHAAAPHARVLARSRVRPGRNSVPREVRGLLPDARAGAAPPVVVLWARASVPPEGRAAPPDVRAVALRGAAPAAVAVPPGVRQAATDAEPVSAVPVHGPPPRRGGSLPVRRTRHGLPAGRSGLSGFSWRGPLERAGTPDSAGPRAR